MKKLLSLKRLKRTLADNRLFSTFTEANGFKFFFIDNND